MNDKFLWVEKYAPQTIDECVLPTNLKEEFSVMTELSNMLFIGEAGVGKTTVAQVLCKTLNTDMMFMNASIENGIDDVRNKIQSFATSAALFGDYKVLFLDEADNLSPDAQRSLRALIEAHQNNCRFILTCNYAHMLIEPLKSRLVEYYFSYPSDGKQLKNVFVKRLLEILTKEKVKVTKEDVPTLMSLVNLSYPNWRNCIHNLQRVTSKGTIDGHLVDQMKELHVSTLVELMKAKNFTKVREWIATAVQKGVAPRKVISQMYKKCLDAGFAKSTRPQAVLIFGDYQHKAASVADQEVNLAAMTAELMMTCEFN